MKIISFAKLMTDCTTIPDDCTEVECTECKRKFAVPNDEILKLEKNKDKFYCNECNTQIGLFYLDDRITKLSNEIEDVINKALGK